LKLSYFFNGLAGAGRRFGAAVEQKSGMKKYIREMLNDLKGGKKAGVTPQTALPEDLSNQELSKDSEEKVKQLDYQAQQSELRQTNS
jgi:hypothetical protein